MPRIHTQTNFRSGAASVGVGGAKGAVGQVGLESGETSASLIGSQSIGGVVAQQSLDAEIAVGGTRRIVGALGVQAAAASLVVAGQAGEDEAPQWPAYFNQLPDAYVGVPYTYDLNSLMSADEWRIVRTNFSLNSGHAVLPAGLTLDTDTGIISGTPTTEELFVGQVIAANGTFDGVADFNTKAALSGVEWATNFPNLASITDYSGVSTSGRDSATYWSGPAAQGGNDSLEGLSGYAMVQEILPTDEYNESANWKRAVKNAGFGTGLNVGEDLYIYWLTKNNRAEASWRFANVDHQMKVAILDTTGTSSSYEVVAQTWRGGVIRGYYGLSPSNIWEDQLGAVSTPCAGGPFDRRWQPAVDLGANPLNGTDPGLTSGNGDGAAWTACQQARAQYGGLYSYISIAPTHEDGFCDPLTGGAYLLIDWWQAWQVHVRRVTSNSTLIEWWWAPLGMDWKLMYTQTVNRGADGFFSGLHMTNSHTNMIEEPGRPPCYRWTDCIVVKFGGSRIPAPGYSS